MSDYLAGYGVTDSRRESRFKLIAGGVILTAILAVTAWYNLRTWSEERVVKQFLQFLSQKNYNAAYQLWGCSAEKPCRDYNLEKFLEDWGEKSPYADIGQTSISLAEPCGNTIWVSLKHPKQEELGLSVDPDTKVLSFAPNPRCPGVWRLRELPQRFSAFWKNQTSDVPPPPRPSVLK